MPRFDADELPVLCPVLHHVNLKTNRLEEMIDWYALVVGMHITFRRHDVAFLTNDAANHRLALRGDRDYPEPADRVEQAGFQHSAFEFRSLDELLLTYVRLERASILPVFCLDHGMTTSFYYEDPDGNRVELQADNWDNTLQSGIFMRDDPRFLDDPVGKPIDPAKILAARRAGLDPWEIHVATYRNELAPDAG